jgi:peptidoglycan/LPS O-acetylase OafA/YrhL
MRLGGFRLILAIMVVATHTLHYPAGWPNIGGVAVAVFFFISGFLMPLAFESNYKFDHFRDRAAHFWLNRFFRIYPWYWLSIMLPLALVLLKGPRNAAQESYFEPTVLLQNFLLLGLNQEQLWGHYIRYNNPAWTLDIELQYYLLVPALVWAYARAPVMSIFGMALASLTSLYLMAVPAGITGIDWSFLASSSLFIGGFLYFQAIKSKLVQRTGYLPLAGAAFLLVSAWLPDPIRLAGITLGLILIAAHLLNIELRSKEGGVSRFLGNLSYPVYIFHFFLIGITQMRASLLFEGSGLSGIALFWAVLSANVLICAIFCSTVVFFGEPIIDRIRSRLKRIEPSSPAPSHKTARAQSQTERG